MERNHIRGQALSTVLEHDGLLCRTSPLRDPFNRPMKACKPDSNEVIPLPLLVDCCSARHCLVYKHATLLILDKAQDTISVIET